MRWANARVRARASRARTRGRAHTLPTSARQRCNPPVELQRGQHRGDFISTHVGARHQRVKVDGIVAERFQQLRVQGFSQLLVRRRCIDDARGGSQADLGQHVVRGLDELRAFADQPMRPFRERRMNGTGNGEHVAALLARKSRGDERARRQRCLDDEHTAGQTAQQAIAPRKVFLPRRRSGPILGEQCSAFRDCARQRSIARRVDAIGAGANDGNRRSRTGESAFVRRRVDAEREP